MRKALLASVSVLAIGCLGTPAQAASPTPGWTGYYVGLNAGYAWGNSNPTMIGSVTGAPFFLPANTGPVPSLTPRGFIGGAQAGYNWQAGQWVFGGEVDFSGLNAKADAAVSPFFKNKPNVTTWSSRYDWLFTARVRGGFTVAPNWLLYATGGLAVTHVTDSVVCTAAGNGCYDFGPGGVTVSWSQTTTLAGGTIGGGLETMFAPNWSARVEYLYAKFKDTTPGIVSFPASPPVPFPPLFSFHHDLNLVRFAINYKFGP